MDLIGNFTLWAHIGRWSCRSTGRSTHCPVDLPMDLNGNFTLWAHIGWWSGRSTGRSDPTSCRSANGSEWQFYSFELILADEVADPLERLTPPPCRSANGSEWQFYCYSAYWQLKWYSSTGRSTPPTVDLPTDVNGNFTLWAHIGRWISRSTGRSTSL